MGVNNLIAINTIHCFKLVLALLVSMGFLAQRRGRFEYKYLLKIRLGDELHNDIFLGLNLEHFQYETQKWGRLNISTENTSYVLQLHSLIHHKLR